MPYPLFKYIHAYGFATDTTQRGICSKSLGFSLHLQRPCNQNGSVKAEADLHPHKASRTQSGSGHHPHRHGPKVMRRFVVSTQGLAVIIITFPLDYVNDKDIYSLIYTNNISPTRHQRLLPKRIASSPSLVMSHWERSWGGWGYTCYRYTAQREHIRSCPQEPWGTIGTSRKGCGGRRFPICALLRLVD